MAKKPKAVPFAELVKQSPFIKRMAAEPVEHESLPGRHNAGGQLLDLNGRPLARIKQDITPREARVLLAKGAVVAHESCGCGGYTGCQPYWMSNDALTRLRATEERPHLVGRNAPTWIDLWCSDTGRVIYLHGDVHWGDELH